MYKIVQSGTVQSGDVHTFTVSHLWYCNLTTGLRDLTLYWWKKTVAQSERPNSEEKEENQGSSSELFIVFPPTANHHLCKRTSETLKQQNDRIKYAPVNSSNSSC